MVKRRFSAYEKNQLRRFGVDPEAIEQFGEQPVEYITGWAQFLGQDFRVTPATLIPRVETEELVELVELAGDDLFVGADVGTGCGAIGISLARRLEQLAKSYELILSDKSSKTLTVAQENSVRLLPKPKFGEVSFLLSDLLTDYPSETQLDFIVANLPYIPTDSLVALDSSVKDFEPLTALDGGPDGLRFINRLLVQAETKLKPGGKIYLELDDSHSAAKFSQFEAVYDFKFFNDQFGKNRFAIVSKKNLIT
jgi:release factor glutamine methyltransferase